MPSALKLVVLNALGLHARPAAEFVRCAMRFPSTQIKLEKDGEFFVATSILEILTANLDEGAMFILHADGPDEDAALAELAALLVHFREEEKNEG